MLRHSAAMYRHAAAVTVVAALACATSSPARAADLGAKCHRDRQCAAGSICSDQGACVPLPNKKSVIPFHFWNKNDGAGTTVVGPFVHRSSARAQSTTSMLFPLVAVHDSPRYSVRVVFPFVWRVRDGNETDTAIFPLY